jgi:hypothetical protein
VTVLRHPAINRDLRLVDRAPVSIANRHGDGLHLSRALGLGRLVRGLVAAVR